MAHADFWVELSEAEEDVAEASEALAEMKQQADSETALFGDAWAGAAIDVERVAWALAEAEARLRKMRALV